MHDINCKIIVLATDVTYCNTDLATLVCMYCTKQGCAVMLCSRQLRFSHLNPGSERFKSQLSDLELG